MTFSRFGLSGFVVLMLAALLNVAVLYTAERGFAEFRDAASRVSHTQEAETLIARIYRKVVDAETGHRGFLLTADPTNLAPYADARSDLPGELDGLAELTRDNPVQVAQLATVRRLLDSRFEQMAEALAQRPERSGEPIRTDPSTAQGMMTMASLRLALDGMAAEERTQYERRYRIFYDNQNQVGRGFLIVVALNLFLASLGGVFLSQESRRRRREAAEVRERNAQLAQAVYERTAELTGLSHYLQQLQEEEKAKIAREIHDELGGTLAAAKIDLQLLSDNVTGESLRVRLARVIASIDETIQVKRRIIEDLRPTLLDNLGIGPALRWQCGQFSKRWNVPCSVELQDENLRLPPAHGIAFYRVVQESLTNVSKYAKAKNVAVSLLRDGEQWVLRVADDGVGFDMANRHNPTAHGLVSMRERARALGGEFSIQGQPMRGTVVEIRVPFGKEPKDEGSDHRHLDDASDA